MESEKRQQQEAAVEQTAAADQQPAEPEPAAQAEPAPPEPAEPEVVEGEPEPDPLAAALADAERYLALAQRTQADFENYRKRMARENAAAIDRGVAKLAKELLPALDHLDLALKAAAEDSSELAKGIRLVQDELLAGLNRAGLQPFTPTGEPFDPTEHEAMVQQAAEGVESGTVLDVFQAGYRLNGQVMRPARVVVAQ